MSESNYVENSDIIQPTEIGEDVLIPVYVSSRFSTGAWSGLIKKFLVAKNTVPSAGTYTPTISGETNGILIAPQQARYIKVGSIVNVFAQLEITMDAGETTGTFEISLPVASNLTSQKDCFGMMQFTALGGGISTTELDVVDVAADITNNTCLVTVETLTAGVTLTYCTLQFTYVVL